MAIIVLTFHADSLLCISLSWATYPVVGTPEEISWHLLDCNLYYPKVFDAKNAGKKVMKDSYVAGAVLIALVGACALVIQGEITGKQFIYAVPTILALGFIFMVW